MDLDGPRRSSSRAALGNGSVSAQGGRAGHRPLPGKKAGCPGPAPSGQRAPPPQLISVVGAVTMPSPASIFHNGRIEAASLAAARPRTARSRRIRVRSSCRDPRVALFTKARWGQASSQAPAVGCIGPGGGPSKIGHTDFGGAAASPLCGPERIAILSLHPRIFRSRLPPSARLPLPQVPHVEPRQFGSRPPEAALRPDL